jgi:uncharacterized protein (DUF983 family)
MPDRSPEIIREFPVYKKISGVRAVFACKCPRCRVGDMFPHSAWNLGRFMNMHPECPHCKQDFKIEPGFYFGAAYISYGMNALVVMLGALIYFLWIPNFPILPFIGILTLLSLLMVPLFFRWSRAVWLHLCGLVKFEEKYLRMVDVQNLMVRFRRNGKSVN